MPIPDKKSRFGNRQVPAYVKQGFPNVLSGTTGGTSYRPGSTGGDGGMFPKIPGAEDNYGMQHNVPESDAEKAMHELWMARRRQEVSERIMMMGLCVALFSNLNFQLFSSKRRQFYLKYILHIECTTAGL